MFHKSFLEANGDINAAALPITTTISDITVAHSEGIALDQPTLVDTEVTADEAVSEHSTTGVYSRTSTHQSDSVESRAPSVFNLSYCG